ncbi:MAG: cyclic pyranopterin monophosphate synthase MoaC [Maricaulaceae bacterium]|jgi:cyclic pyranopterin phosphate synthase
MADGPLTHQDAEGRVRMVDVSAKAATARTAIAAGEVTMSPDAFEAVRSGQGPKGDALAVAELAGIMAAKKTSELIPLCHSLPLSSAKVSIEPIEGRAAFEVRAEVRTTAETGVEMEALTAVSVACLTLYDMAKALDKAMTISNVRLLKKTGGKSGDFVAESQA